MAQDRICMMCGTKYQYCPHCGEYNPDEQWRLLVHDKKCLDLSRLWYAYRGGEITKSEAKERMGKIKPNIDNVLKHKSLAADEIKEIFGVNEKPDVLDINENASDIEKTEVNNKLDIEPSEVEVKVNRKRPSKKEIAESE